MAKRRHRVNRAERVEPTPETIRHLQPDPLHGLLHTAWAHLPADIETLNRQLAERAAEEIRAVYFAVLRPLMPKANRWDAMQLGHAEIPDSLARAHKDRYLPWTRDNAPNTVDATLSIVIDREEPGVHTHRLVARALLDYARRMRA